LVVETKTLGGRAFSAFFGSQTAPILVFGQLERD
jgi:hypothetical protein